MLRLLSRGREAILGKEKNRATFEEAIRFLRKALTLTRIIRKPTRASPLHTYSITRTAGATTRQLAAAGKAVRAAGGREGHERAFGDCVAGMAAVFERDLDRAKPRSIWRCG